MKKIFTILTILLSAMTLFAQDVIVTKDAQKITAKITEVSANEIKYLDSEMPDGPTFVLSTNEIASIIYATGKVKVFNQDNAPSVVVKDMPASYQYNQLISRCGNTYWCNGMPLKGKTYEQFLQENCIEAYTHYKKGQNTATAGWALLGVGLATNFACNLTVAIDSYLYDDPILMFFTCLGTALELAAVPTLIVGYHKKHQSANIYNREINKNRTQAYWSLNASQNGFGLALNF